MDLVFRAATPPAAPGTPIAGPATIIAKEKRMPTAHRAARRAGRGQRDRALLDDARPLGSLARRDSEPQIVGKIRHNYGSVRQLSLTATVRYAADLDQGVDTARDVVLATRRVRREPAPVLGVTALGNGVTVSIGSWVPVREYVEARAESYQAPVAARRDRQIDLNVPQDVRLVRERD
jgi:hypothetical protein